tara:strand:- start:985 stop:1125 length:141 start_codon:yes stop_codon:yes gene_type:complete
MRLAIFLGFFLGLIHGTIVSDSVSANNFEYNQLFFSEKNQNIFPSM